MKDRIIAYICKDMEGRAPGEIQLMPYGYVKTPNGEFLCDDDSAKMIIEAFSSQKNDMVIDYEHQTLAGVEAPAAGWIKQVINKGKEGIWAVVEWTAKAESYIANREYRYISPVFLKRLADNRVIKLINAGLTNQPNIDGMAPLINKSQCQVSVSKDDVETGFKPVSTTKKKEETIMKGLLKALGLPEAATEEDAIAVANKLLAEQASNKSVIEALGLTDGATVSEITGTIMAMKQSAGKVSEMQVLQSQLTDLKASIALRDAGESVALAMKEGKITPAQKDWALEYARRDIEGFKVFAAKAPVVVPLGDIAGGEPKSAGRIDDIQISVNKMLDIAPETFEKHNPKEG